MREQYCECRNLELNNGMWLPFVAMAAIGAQQHYEANNNAILQ